MLREGILLQELALDDVSNIQSQFLIFGKGVFTDQLHDFI